MSAFGKLLRAGRQRPAVPFIRGWSELLAAGDAQLLRGLVSGKGLCAAACATVPTEAAAGAASPAMPAEAFAADAEASLNETHQKEPPPVPEFLQSLGISEEKWAAQQRKPVSKTLMLNIGVLEKFGSTVDDRKRMVLGTSASLDTFRKTNPNNLERKLTWLMNEYGLQEHQAVRVVSRHPPFVNYAVKTNVASFLSMVMQTAELEKSQIKDMLLSHPQIVGYGKKFEQLASRAQAVLGMSRKQVAQCVAACPRMLSYSIANTTEPTFAKMLELGLTKEEAIAIFMAAPKLIGRKFARTVDGKLAWLVGPELGVTKEQALGILKNHPMAFYPKVDAWIETKKWFLGLDERHTTEHFARFLGEVDFSLLGRRMDGLSFIMNFCKDVLKRSQEDILACPQIFDALFLLHTLPRVAFYDSKGRDLHEISLHALSTASDEEYYKDFDMDEVERFVTAFRKLNRDGKMAAIKSKQYPKMD